MEHGSLQNQLMGRVNQAPTVGMGTTHLSWTDRHPYTVIEVSANGKRCKVQEDSYTRTDDHGVSECQQYTFEPNPKGAIVELKLGRDGCWYGPGGKKNGARFMIGVRKAYHDFSF